VVYGVHGLGWIDRDVVVAATILEARVRLVMACQEVGNEFADIRSKLRRLWADAPIVRQASPDDMGERRRSV